MEEISENKNKKELIISAFEKMDISLMEILLDDSKTYEDARKDVFLEELNVVFENFKKESDTALIAYKGQCVSASCPNKGIKGYCFAGNKSQNYFNLLFDENAEDNDIIYQCNDFKTEMPVLKLNNELTLSVGRDEAARFIPSIEYQNYFRRSEAALFEMIKDDEDAYLSKEDYLPW